MNKLSGRRKIIIAVSLILLLYVSGHYAGFWSVLGADELNLSARSLTIDGSVKSGGGQQVITWDKDGPITITTANLGYAYYTYATGGYKYPELQFTVGDLSYTGVYDNITVTTPINNTHSRIENYIIYAYSFKVWIKGEADSKVIKNVMSAYEGKFASESPYQPTAPLSFAAKVGLDILPFSFTDADQYGVTWMQIADVKVTENIPKYTASPDVVFYSADRDLANVGATWGQNYKANQLIGKELPSTADLTLYGSYRAGSVCLYDPNNLIPGDLYQVVPIEPVLEVTCNIHIAGYNFYIEDERAAGIVAAPPPPPAVPSVLSDLIVLIILVVASIPIMIFALPRVIYAFRRRR